MSNQEKNNRFQNLSVWIVAACPLIFVILFFILTRPSNEVVHKWQQPASITYDGQGPYYLAVVKSDLDWRGFPFEIRRNYSIYVGRDPQPSYGHWVDLSFFPEPDDMKTFLNKASTNWTDQGVELVLPSDHRVFIPKDAFTGGR